MSDRPVSRSVLRRLIDDFPLDRDGIHGPFHWARVLENGRRLAAVTGADLRVVELFALFHDCRRHNDGEDPAHGKRGARLAVQLHQRGDLSITAQQLEQLRFACAAHTAGLIEADPTVQTCWDADRLDLGRVWITPSPHRLCTDAARDPETLGWADDRARREVKSTVLEEWLG